MKKIAIVFLILIFVFFSMYSCEALTKVTEKIPEIAMTIPASLASTVKSVKATTGAPDAPGVFQPFRDALSAADWGIDTVNQIINTLNENYIPDSFAGVIGNYYVVVSTDSSRTYAVRINIYNGTTEDPATLMLQINYNKGEVKGEFILDVQQMDSSSDVSMVKIFYDGTVTGSEQLKGWVTWDTSSPSSAIYPINLYFHGYKDGDLIDFEGGVLYNYVFDDGTNPHSYEANHVYMFKAVNDPVNDYSTVKLYFPESTVSDNTSLKSIDEAFLTILFTWVNYPENNDVQSALTSAGIGWDENAGVTEQDFKTNLETWQTNNPDDPSLDSILFILNLDNPIYYNNVDGYVANGASPAVDVSAYPLALLLDSITFIYTPDDFENSTDFNISFLTD